MKNNFRKIKQSILNFGLKFYLNRFIRKIDNKITLFLIKHISKILVINFRKASNNHGKVICFTLENLGDTVRASGIINFLNNHYKSFIVCTEYNQKIIELMGIDPNRILVLRRDPGIIDLVNLLKFMKKNSIERSIILDHSNSKLFPLYCSKIANIKNIHWIDIDKIKMEEIIDFSNMHNIDILTTLKVFILKEILGEHEFHLYLHKENLKYINLRCEDKLYDRYKEYIGIHIGGFGSVLYSVSRKYPEEYTYKLILELLNKGFKIVLTGDNSDMKFFEKYIKELSRFENFQNLAGKLSIKELSCLLKSLKLYITPDNGTLHIAQAVGCKNVIVLLGPTSPLLVKGTNTYILREELWCSPCIKFIDFPKKCVHNEEICLLNLNYKKIIKLVEDLLCTSK